MSNKMIKAQMHLTAIQILLGSYKKRPSKDETNALIFKAKEVISFLNETCHCQISTNFDDELKVYTVVYKTTSVAPKIYKYYDIDLLLDELCDYLMAV